MTVQEDQEEGEGSGMSQRSEFTRAADALFALFAYSRYEACNGCGIFRHYILSGDRKHDEGCAVGEFERVRRDVPNVETPT